MTGHVKVGGTWKQGTPYIKVAGAWKPAQSAWVKVNGVWKQWYTAAFTLPNIGDNVYGGYFAGVIDTTATGGSRYMLICAPAASRLATSYWKTANSAGPAATRTRWDGLTATDAMYAAGPTTYPAAKHCTELSYPSDGGSHWYLPALDEAELLYRNLKPLTTANYVGAMYYVTGGYPYSTVTTDQVGYNPSSSPQGAAYTTSNPAQTSLALFQSGGAQALYSGSGSVQMWTSTEGTTARAWFVYVGGATNGRTLVNDKIGQLRVCPVRRIPF